jgi:acyl dehydratase
MSAGCSSVVRRDEVGSVFPEDLSEGQVFNLGCYRIEEDEIIAFAKKYDPIPIHIDPVAAAVGPFEGVIASGINTIGICQRLFVSAVRASGGVGRSLNVRFLRPVYPGTTLTGRSTVLKVTLRPERHDAIVLFDTVLVNDAGEIVLGVQLDALLHLRPDP